MRKTFSTPTSLVYVFLIIGIVISGCQSATTAAPTTAPAVESTQAQGVEPTGAPATAVPEPGEMTDVGTPRNETLIFQTFDRQTANPDQHNPLMAYAQWRGFRELGWGYLWETDTGTGKSYAELADGDAEALNEEYTLFRIKIKQGIYWSDGVEFTVDDIIYTLDTVFSLGTKLTAGGNNTVRGFVKEGGYKKIDNYTFEVETTRKGYDIQQVLGVPTYGSPLVIVPKHIFEQQADIPAFRNTKPVTLGPYTLKEFDPNGYWALWQRRDDWQRSAWGWMGEVKPKYVLYKDFGPEEIRILAFVQNKYDIDTFMSPDGIKAAQSYNPAITTFSDKLPYHNMNDACSYGVIMNQHKDPLDKVEVRWALALSLDLASVSINSMSGEVHVSPLPMVDSTILRPIYFEPLLPWLNDFALSDGYKPFNPNFVPEFAAKIEKAGVPASAMPQGDKALSEAFGVGWWKYDVAEAEKLLLSAGFTRDDKDQWLQPDGTLWKMEFAIPGDWNKVMQRIGFSMADSWKKFGITVNLRQLDNAEFTANSNTNATLQTQLTWVNCIFTENFVTNNWRGINAANLKAADSPDRISGNVYRWNNPKVFDLMVEAQAMPFTSDRFHEIGQEVLKEFVTDMAFINIMNIPTTIPTNETYWTNFPKADNFYAVPYSWWSSVRETIINIEPTGKR